MTLSSRALKILILGLVFAFSALALPRVSFAAPCGYFERFVRPTGYCDTPFRYTPSSDRAVQQAPAVTPVPLNNNPWEGWRSAPPAPSAPQSFQYTPYSESALRQAPTDPSRGVNARGGNQSPPAPASNPQSPFFEFPNPSMDPRSQLFEFPQPLPAAPRPARALTPQPVQLSGPSPTDNSYGRVGDYRFNLIAQNCREDGTAGDLGICMRNSIATWQGGNFNTDDQLRVNQYLNAQTIPPVAPAREFTPAETRLQGYYSQELDCYLDAGGSCTQSASYLDPSPYSTPSPTAGDGGLQRVGGAQNLYTDPYQTQPYDDGFLGGYNPQPVATPSTGNFFTDIGNLFSSWFGGGAASTPAPPPPPALAPSYTTDVQAVDTSSGVEVRPVSSPELIQSVPLPDDSWSNSWGEGVSDWFW